MKAASVREVPHVVIAEDDPYLRAQMERAIREMGWSVTAVSDGREALERIEADASLERALLVTDVRMPGCDGIDLLAELALRGRRLRSIVVTGFADDQTQQMAFSLGAMMVFSKPFDIDALCTALAFISLGGA